MLKVCPCARFAFRSVSDIDCSNAKRILLFARFGFIGPNLGEYERNTNWLYYYAGEGFLLPDYFRNIEAFMIDVSVLSDLIDQGGLIQSHQRRAIKSRNASIVFDSKNEYATFCIGERDDIFDDLSPKCGFLFGTKLTLEI